MGIFFSFFLCQTLPIFIFSSLEGKQLKQDFSFFHQKANKISSVIHSLSIINKRKWVNIHQKRTKHLA